MGDVSAVGASALSDAALKRQQRLLQELNTLRLQEKLLRSIMGSDATEESGLAFYIDQLALNEVSKAEKTWLSELERESGVSLQGSDVMTSLTSVLAAFNRNSP